jgi:integrase
VFTTRAGTPRDRHNVRARVLVPSVARANKRLAEQGHPSIVGLTNHSLRRTFASLMYEAGASPAQVMAQMGHTSASMALEVYAKMMSRDRDTGVRIDALVRGEKPPMGTNEAVDATTKLRSDNEKERQTA